MRGEVEVAAEAGLDWHAAQVRREPEASAHGALRRAVSRASSVLRSGTGREVAGLMHSSIEEQEMLRREEAIRQEIESGGRAACAMREERRE